MKWLTWPSFGRFTEFGHVVLRVGLGVMIMMHGWPKVQGGPAKWAGLGKAMQVFGIDFFPTFWGGAAAFTELVGGAMLVLGLGTRPAAALLAFVMVVAAANDLADGSGVMGAAHPIETGIGFVALIFLGSGRYSVDRSLGGGQGR